MVTLVRVCTVLRNATPNAALLEVLRRQNEAVEISTVSDRVTMMLEVVRDAVVLMIRRRLTCNEDLLRNVVRVSIGPFAAVNVLVLDLLDRLVRLDLSTRTSNCVCRRGLTETNIYGT